MLMQGLIKLSYLLNEWERYRHIKTFVFNLLENDRYPYKRWFDITMVFIILSSVFILVIEVKEPVPKWLDDFDLYFVTTVFIVEYLLRLWVFSDVHKMIIRAYEEGQFLSRPLSFNRTVTMVLQDKWQYISSPAAIIDLIAILPSYREIRVLRIFVLFRAFKMLRYSRSLGSFLFILKSKKFELITLLTLTTFFVFIAGIMLYVLEGDGDNPQIHSLFDAFYWALITISTVGYGDISPATSEGRVVSMLIIVTGIGLISFLTSIIVSSFSERLTELREDRVMQEVGKKSAIVVLCGFGIMGRKVASGLVQEQSELIVIDRDPDASQRAHSMGYRSICADATQSEVFERIGVYERISHVLCLTSDDEQNAFIAINVKSLNPGVQVIARCSDREIADKLRYAGVDEVIIPEALTAMMGSVYAGEPVAFEAIRSILSRRSEERIDEIPIRSGGMLDGKTLAEAETWMQRMITLGVVRRNAEGALHFHFNPGAAWRLSAGDELIVIGHESAVNHFKRKVQ